MPSVIFARSDFQTGQGLMVRSPESFPVPADDTKDPENELSKRKKMRAYEFYLREKGRRPFDWHTAREEKKSGKNYTRNDHELGQKDFSGQCRCRFRCPLFHPCRDLGAWITRRLECWDTELFHCSITRRDFLSPKGIKLEPMTNYRNVP